MIDLQTQSEEHASERINERNTAFGACARVLRKLANPDDRVRVISALGIIFDDGLHSDTDQD